MYVTGEESLLRHPTSEALSFGFKAEPLLAFVDDTTQLLPSSYYTYTSCNNNARHY